MKKLLFAAAVLASVLCASCYRAQGDQAKVSEKSESPVWYEDEKGLWDDLAAAVADAKQLDSSKICHELMPIKKGYPGQEWGTFDGHDMVLVVTLVDTSRMERFFGRDGVYRIDREMGTWVSLPADWVRHRKAFEGLDSVAAHMRLIQLFGISPDCDYDIMVQFYADPKGMFRPSHDPDITTTEAVLEFPAYVLQEYPRPQLRRAEWVNLNGPWQFAFDKDGNPTSENANFEYAVKSEILGQQVDMNIKVAANVKLSNQGKVDASKVAVPENVKSSAVDASADLNDLLKQLESLGTGTTQPAA